MDRKKFIKASGIGLGAILLPRIGKSAIAAENSTKTLQSTSKIIKDSDGEILNVIGDIQTHKLSGGDTENQVVEWVDNVKPGVGIHSKEDEIFRVVKGKVEIMVGGKTTVLNEGDTAYAPKNVPHSWKVVGTENAKMITSAFPGGIEYMFRELAALPEGPPNVEEVAKICLAHGISFV